MLPISDFPTHTFYRSLGNTYELNEEECTDEAVARDIIQINDPEREKDIETWRESKNYSDSRALKNAEESIDREVNELTNLFIAIIKNKMKA